MLSNVFTSIVGWTRILSRPSTFTPTPFTAKMHKYKNPWPSFTPPNLKTILSSVKLDFRSSSNGQYPTKVLSPNLSPSDTDLRVMWIGHATVYLQYRHSEGMLGILFDPIWSMRCSPCPLFGRKRGLSPPCRVTDLPAVDIVIISHDHYDHLDKKTIEEIERRYGGVQYYVPQGLKRILSRFGVSADRISEQSWWEEVDYHPLDHGKASGAGLQVKIKEAVEVFGHHDTTSNASSIALVDSDREGEIATFRSSTSTLIEARGRPFPVKIACTPAQHNSGRSVFSQNKTLWASWMVELPRLGQQPWRIFFGGDTGYRSNVDGPVCPIFQEIRQRYGAPDLALLPIAAGSVLPFLEHLVPLRLDHRRLTSSIHCTPADAVKISQLMGAKKTLCIHWGTFTTPAHATQTLMELQRARKERNVGGDWSRDDGFRVANVGEWLDVMPSHLKGG